MLKLVNTGQRRPSQQNGIAMDDVYANRHIKKQQLLPENVICELGAAVGRVVYIYMERCGYVIDMPDRK